MTKDNVKLTLTTSEIIKKYNTTIIDIKLLRKILKEEKCLRYKKIEVSHPNILFKKNYGSLYDMLNYVTKKRLVMWTTDNLDNYLKKLLALKNKKNYKLERKEPDWAQMYHDGFSLQDVINLLKEKYTNQFVKNYYKWSAGIHAVFCKNNEDFEYNGDLGFWIPIVVLDWLDLIKLFLLNHNNKNWLKKNRHLRPKSLIWFGATKRGKTTFIRQFFYLICNYYQFLFDGMETFNENHIVTILDDFNIDLNHFLPGWKCWLGSQTGFSINPKFGRRRKLNWGHPCVFLSNKSENSLFKDLDEEEKDFINENCIIVNTGKRYLFKKPTDLETLASCRFITIQELREKYGLPTTFDELNASDIENEYQENKPILLNENGKRPLGRLELPKLKRRTGSGFFY